MTIKTPAHELRGEIEDDSPPWVVSERTGRIGIELDQQTGLAVAIVAEIAPGRRERIALHVSATLVTEGDEVDGQPFGLAYANTIELSDFSLRSHSVRHEYAGYDEIFIVETRAGTWDIDWEYRFRGSAPRLEIQIVLSPHGDHGKATLRNLHLGLDFRPSHIGDWKVYAPGSPIRPGIAADSIVEGRT